MRAGRGRAARHELGDAAIGGGGLATESRWVRPLQRPGDGGEEARPEVTITRPVVGGSRAGGHETDAETARTAHRHAALRPARAGDQGARGGVQQRPRLVSGQDLRAHEGAVDEEQQLPRQLVGALDSQPLGDPLQTRP